MKRILLLMVAGLTWTALPTPTRACSVTPGYLMPSNFELVRDAEAIVLAKAVRALRQDDRVEQFEFEVAKVLKGTLEQKTLTLPGNDRWLGPSEPGNFSKARPGAFRGACIAYDYNLHSQFILFLRRKDGMWLVSGPPFTRVNEEVSGTDAPWTQAVVHYARIAALKTADLQKQALRRLADEGGNIDGLVQDIDRHFHLPHGSKPFEDLKKMYDEAGDDGKRSAALWAFANGRHAEAAELIRELLRSGDWTRFPGPVSEYVTRLKDSSCVDPMLKALLSEDLTALPTGRWEVLWAVSRAATAADAPGMLDLLKSTEGESVRPLLHYFARHPDPQATADLKRRIDKDYVKESDWTFFLVAMGDRDVLAWALDASRKPGENRWIALYSLAVSPHAEADQAAQEILKGPDLEAADSVIQGYGRSRSPHRLRRILEGFELRTRRPQIDWSARYALRELIEEGDGEAAKALEKLPPRLKEKP